MSVLLGHARAARILSDAFGEEAAQCGDERNGLLLTRMAGAYFRAAVDMEEAMRQDAEDMPSACTIDHATIAGAQVRRVRRAQERPMNRRPVMNRKPLLLAVPFVLPFWAAIGWLVWRAW